MIPEDVFRVAQIQKRALARMDQGAATYGVFDPETDGRDLFQEAEDELLDVMNYAAMLVLRIREIKKKFYKSTA